MGKKKTVDDDSGHRMGKYCGYTLKEGGLIRPAPTYAQQFEKLSSERNGINDLMKLFSSHCADLLAEMNRINVRLWDSICADYGLNKETHNISFDGTHIVLTPKSAPTPDSASCEEKK